jgi:hypothetical protein
MNECPFYEKMLNETYQSFEYNAIDMINMV